jgi:hypothetical protein
MSKAESINIAVAARNLKLKNLEQFKYLYDEIVSIFKMNPTNIEDLNLIPDYDIRTYRALRKLNIYLLEYILGKGNNYGISDDWRIGFFTWYPFIMKSYFTFKGKEYTFFDFINCKNYFPEVIQNEFAGFNVPEDGFKVLALCCKEQSGCHIYKPLQNGSYYIEKILPAPLCKLCGRENSLHYIGEESCLYCINLTTQ